MKSRFAGIRRLVLPWGAPVTSPRIVIGPDIPAELVAFYGSSVDAVILFYSGQGGVPGIYLYIGLYHGPAVGAIVIGEYNTVDVREYARIGMTNDVRLGNTYYQDPTSNVFNAFDWTNVTLLNAWVNSGAPTALLRVRRVPSPPRSIQICGTVVAPGVFNAIACSVPVGYEPAHQVAVHAWVGGATPAMAVIRPDGTVQTSGVAAGQTVWINGIYSLDS